DKLTAWDVKDDEGEPAPVESLVMSGSSDPMAIPVTPLERQFTNFAEAIRTGGKPLVSGEEGYRALELVLSVYRSCREGQKVAL
ncbi:MAG: gfo/Idh/MocA family oxidoreductase, partial [Bryobacterales bacterium]|nr:gfo/Idh/MocA family oxidoreductase [Bryobacterales bacterium]